MTRSMLLCITLPALALFSLLGLTLGLQTQTGLAVLSALGSALHAVAGLGSFVRTTLTLGGESLVQSLMFLTFLTAIFLSFFCIGYKGQNVSRRFTAGDQDHDTAQIRENRRIRTILTVPGLADDYLSYIRSMQIGLPITFLWIAAAISHGVTFSEEAHDAVHLTPIFVLIMILLVLLGSTYTLMTTAYLAQSRTITKAVRVGQKGPTQT